MEQKKKLNFINKSSGKKIESMELNKILFAKNNPRFALLDGLNIDIVEFIKKDTTFNNQKEIFINILESEDDLNDLLSLLESIKEIGFENFTEPLFLINSNKNNENYWIVAEGNRRLMCLKLILDKDNYKMPDFEIYMSNIIEKDNIISEYINDGEEIDEKSKEVKKRKLNYEKIKNILDEINLEKFEWNVTVEIVENNESNLLWKMIYDKHLTGKRPGMRDWSRAKYFADLLNMFPDGISNNSQNQNIFRNINRDKKVVIKDFKEHNLFIHVFLHFFYQMKILILVMKKF